MTDIRAATCAGHQVRRIIPWAFAIEWIFGSAHLSVAPIVGLASSSAAVFS
jgi:hypothetical protein